MWRGSKIIVIITILILIFILLLSFGGYFVHDNKYKDSINNVCLGEVGMKYNYTNITFPHHVYSSSEFNVTIFFNSNISIKFIYTQTSGFRVTGWKFSYNDYTMTGKGQGNFTGTFSENIGILNVTFSTPTGYYNGNLALHLVGNVPVTVIY